MKANLTIFLLIALLSSQIWSNFYKDAYVKDWFDKNCHELKVLGLSIPAKPSHFDRLMKYPYNGKLGQFPFICHGLAQSYPELVIR